MRRILCSLLAVLAVLIPAAPAAAQELSFADGYHGGYFLSSVVGLREAFMAVFGLLDAYPQYRANLEIEPYTLEKLKYGPRDEWERSQAIASDLSIVKALQRYISDGRIELVGGAYTQPLLFATSGESAIRQFIFGTRAIRDVLGIDVATYAAQEPCFSSQLPQILDGFGFRSAVLKNTWALFGNPPATDSARVQWEGPDGSRIDTSPRYVFDGYSCYVLDIFPGRDFLARAAHLDRPITFNLGDFIKLGVSASIPWFSEKDFLRATPSYLRYTTWKDYFQGSSGDAAPEWKLGYNDFEYRFPWGLLAGRVQQRVSEAEQSLLQAERLASMARLAVGAPYPAEALSNAWKYLLLAQHHDAWVCAPTSFGGWASTRTYADWVDVWTGEVERLAGESAAASVRRLAASIPAIPRGLAVIGVNTLPWDYSGTVDLGDVEFPQGTYPAQVAAADSAGHSVPVSVQVLERYRDGSIRKANVQLIGALPPFGYTWFSLVPVPASRPKPLASARSEKGVVTLENQFYRVRVSARGVESIWEKQRQLELLGGPVRLTGLFPTAGGLQTSTSVKVSIRKGGSFSCTARTEGSIGGVPFTVDVSLPAEKRIDLAVSLDFGSGTYIGRLNEDAVVAWTNDEEKLALRLPLKMTSPVVTADAPFDIYEPDRPSFQALGWVHVADAGRGLAVTAVNDRATSFFTQPTAGGTDLGVVLAYGGPFEYAPDKVAPVRGKADYRLSLLSGDTSSNLSEAWRKRLETANPPVGLIVGAATSGAAATGAAKPGASGASSSGAATTASSPGAPSPGTAAQRFLQLLEGETTLEAAYIEDDGLIVRLFNPSAKPGSAKLELAASLTGGPIHETRMDGTDIRVVEPEGSLVRLEMRPFEVKTLKIDLPREALSQPR